MNKKDKKNKKHKKKCFRVVVVVGCGQFEPPPPKKKRRSSKEQRRAALEKRKAEAQAKKEEALEEKAKSAALAKEQKEAEKQFAAKAKAKSKAMVASQAQYNALWNAHQGLISAVDKISLDKFETDSYIKATEKVEEGGALIGQSLDALEVEIGVPIGAIKAYIQSLGQVLSEAQKLGGQERLKEKWATPSMRDGFGPALTSVY